MGTPSEWYRINRTAGEHPDQEGNYKAADIKAQVKKEKASWITRT